MEKMITGYQYSPADGRFIGEYEFPNNKDQEEIHVPPNTTMEAPPACDPGAAPYWQNGFWVIRALPDEVNVPKIDDYAMITDSFIQYLIEIGRWTAEDQQKRADALDQMARQQVEEAQRAAQLTAEAAAAATTQA